MGEGGDERFSEEEIGFRSIVETSVGGYVFNIFLREKLDAVQGEIRMRVKKTIACASVGTVSFATTAYMGLEEIGLTKTLPESFDYKMETMIAAVAAGAVSATVGFYISRESKKKRLQNLQERFQKILKVHHGYQRRSEEERRAPYPLREVKTFFGRLFPEIIIEVEGLKERISDLTFTLSVAGGVVVDKREERKERFRMPRILSNAA